MIGVRRFFILGEILFTMKFFMACTALGSQTPFLVPEGPGGERCPPRPLLDHGIIRAPAIFLCITAREAALLSLNAPEDQGEAAVFNSSGSGSLHARLTGHWYDGTAAAGAAAMPSAPKEKPLP